MAYLKGGTVVDGNLYVEGTLVAKKESAQEGVVYTYAKELSKNLNFIAKFGDSDGQLSPSALSEEVTDDGLEINTRNKPVYFAIPASELTILYKDNKESTINEGLSAFSSKGIKIQETAYVPNSTPKWWGYDAVSEITLTGTDGLYVIPDEEITGIKPGNSVIASGTIKAK